MSAGEFAKKMLSGDGFGGSPVRQCLFAIFLTVKDENTQQGLNWPHKDASASALLAGAVRNEHV